LYSAAMTTSPFPYHVYWKDIINLKKII